MSPKDLSERFIAESIFTFEKTIMQYESLAQKNQLSIEKVYQLEGAIRFLQRSLSPYSDYLPDLNHLLIEIRTLKSINERDLFDAVNENCNETKNLNGKEN